MTLTSRTAGLPTGSGVLSAHVAFFIFALYHLATGLKCYQILRANGVLQPLLLRTTPQVLYLSNPEKSAVSWHTFLSRYYYI